MVNWKILFFFSSLNDTDEGCAAETLSATAMTKPKHVFRLLAGGFCTYSTQLSFFSE